MYRFNYEDTDKKIEIDIYGLIFEIKNIDKDNIEDLRNSKDKDVIESKIESILGKGCIEKINDKRIKDGYDKLTLEVEINIMACILEAYCNATVDNFKERIENTRNNIDNKVNNFRYNKNNYKKNNYKKKYNNRRNWR